MSAPGRSAALYEEVGRSREARAVLERAEERALDVLERRGSFRGWSDIWRHVGDTRLALGRAEDAAAAWRNVAVDGATRNERGQAFLQIGRLFLDAGMPDSAAAYAREAHEGFRRGVTVESILLLAEAQSAAGDQSAALKTYEVVLDDHPRADAACARARFERGRIYESADNWVQARSQYRALSARYPTHELSFESHMRIVDYHLLRGETALARVEGRRSLETVERIIETQRGPETQFMARRTRARILVSMQEFEDAAEALAAFWSRYPRTVDGVDAAFEAAAIAERRLDDAERAVELYRQVESETADVDAKERARQAIDRLDRGGEQES